MGAVKRNLVVGYSRKLKRIRFLVNALALLINYPRLPKEGEAFRDVSITDFAVKNRDPFILKALLYKIYNEYRKRKYHIMIFGCHSDDPIKEAAMNIYSQSVISQIHVFSKSQHIVDQFDDESFPLIDMTLL